MQLLEYYETHSRKNDEQTEKIEELTMDERTVIMRELGEFIQSLRSEQCT